MSSRRWFLALLVLWPGLAFGSISDLSEITTSGSWYQITNSVPRNVYLTLPTMPYGGGNYPSLGVFSYSGALYDTTRHRMVIYGGGHSGSSGYNGNEMYALDLDELASGWQLIWGPDPAYSAISPCTTELETAVVPTTACVDPKSDVNPWTGQAGANDGLPTPNSRHTGTSLVYDPARDKYLIGGYATSPLASGDLYPWTFTPSLAAGYPWQRLTSLVYAGTISKSQAESAYQYDREADRIYTFYKLGTTSGGLYELDPTNGYARTKKVTNTESSTIYRFSAIDPGTITGKHWMVFITSTTAGVGNIEYVDLATMTSFTTATTTGDLSFTGAGMGRQGGLIWYPPRQKFLWFNARYYNGTSPWPVADREIYEIDHTTTPWTVSKITDAAADIPTDISQNGPYGRFNYDAYYNVLVYAPGWNQSAYVMRLDARPYTQGVWTAVASPTSSNGPCPDGKCKHVRVAPVGPNTGRLAFYGGDYNDSRNSYSIGGRRNLWFWNAWNNTWAEKNTYCESTLQPHNPDEMVWVWEPDSLRLRSIAGYEGYMAKVGFESGGTYQPVEGDTIIGNTSGTSAVLAFGPIAGTSGTWAGGDRAGVFRFTQQTGLFTTGETLRIGSYADVATVTSYHAETCVPDYSVYGQNMTYSPVSDSWTSSYREPYPALTAQPGNYQTGALAYPDNVVVVFAGGAVVLEYDIATDTWLRFPCSGGTYGYNPGATPSWTGTYPAADNQGNVYTLRIIDDDLWPLGDGGSRLLRWDASQNTLTDLGALPADACCSAQGSVTSPLGQAYEQQKLLYDSRRNVLYWPQSENDGVHSTSIGWIGSFWQYDIATATWSELSTTTSNSTQLMGRIAGYDPATDTVTITGLEYSAGDTPDAQPYLYVYRPGATEAPVDCTDADGDGFCVENGIDCDDTNATVHHGATDTCGDSIDQDCSGSDLVCPDPIPAAPGQTRTRGTSAGSLQ